MRGTRVKKLRKEAHLIYIEMYKEHGKKLLPFKNIFKQIKKSYNLGVDVFKKVPLGSV